MIFVVLGIDLLHVRPLRHNASVGENIQGKKRENSTNFYHVHAHGNRILSLHANILSNSIRFLLSVSSLLACITRSVDRVDRCKHTHYE